MIKINKNLKTLVLAFALFLLPACIRSNKTSDQNPKKVHKAHLTTGWYLQNKDLLNVELDSYFKFAQQYLDVVVDANSIKALIVPHAGIYFSGICAASAFQNLLVGRPVRRSFSEVESLGEGLFKNKISMQKNEHIKRVIILAPTHTKTFKGISLPDYDIYQTVLGSINVGKKAIDVLQQDEIFIKVPGIHNVEHAIEIELPFLQKTIKSFEIVPLIVGNIQDDQYDQICKILKKIIDDTTLIVVSSDFVHHGPNYGYVPFPDKILNKVRLIDSIAIEAIANKSFDNFDAVLNRTQATICGRNAIKILLKLIEQNVFGEIESRLSCYYTSPQLQNARLTNKIQTQKLFDETQDEKAKNSVSYAGIIFTTEKLKNLSEKDRLTMFEKRSLLKLARDTIKNYFEKKEDKLSEHLLWPIRSFGLNQRSGVFVTLNTRSGQLLGCVGRIVSDLPLYQTVQNVSISSAFHDSRFKPLQQQELDDIVIDISVLTSPRKIKNYKDIVLGRDGIILKKGSKFAVFLPQVPLSFGWDLQKTLEHLSAKAGIGKDGFKQDCEFEVFQGFEINEKDF